MDFSKDFLIGFSIIQYQITRLDEGNLCTFQMDMDCRDENLPMIYLPLSKVSSYISRSHVFSKEMKQDLRDNMVSRLVASRATFHFLYAIGIVLSLYISSHDRIIISIVEKIQQEIFMNNLFHELVNIEKGICINIFICYLIVFYFFRQLMLNNLFKFIFY